MITDQIQNQTGSPSTCPFVPSEELLNKELEFRKSCYRSVKIFLWNNTSLDYKITSIKVVGDYCVERSELPTTIAANSAIGIQVGNKVF